MWQTIIGFIGGPVIKGLIDAYNMHLKAQSADAVTAANLAGKEIAAQQIEIQSINALKAAEIGHPWEPEKIAFYITMVPYAKIMVWDKAFGFLTGGSTDPITGAAGVWAGLIMSFYFGKRTFENVARIIKR